MVVLWKPSVAGFRERVLNRKCPKQLRGWVTELEWWGGVEGKEGRKERCGER